MNDIAGQVAVATQWMQRATWTSDEMAYLIRLAFTAGIRYRATYAEGEMLASWAAHHHAPPTREERIAAELAAYGPVKYEGGDISAALLAEWDEHIAAHRGAR
jgi:hypothetical protein